MLLPRPFECKLLLILFDRDGKEHLCRITGQVPEPAAAVICSQEDIAPGRAAAGSSGYHMFKRVAAPCHLPVKNRSVKDIQTAKEHGCDHSLHPPCFKGLRVALISHIPPKVTLSWTCSPEATAQPSPPCSSELTDSVGQRANLRGFPATNTSVSMSITLETAEEIPGEVHRPQHELGPRQDSVHRLGPIHHSSKGGRGDPFSP